MTSCQDIKNKQTKKKQKTKYKTKNKNKKKQETNKQRTTSAHSVEALLYSGLHARCFFLEGVRDSKVGSYRRKKNLTICVAFSIWLESRNCRKIFIIKIFSLEKAANNNRI